METAQAFSETAVWRWATGEDHVELKDMLAVEEPLEIRVGSRYNGKSSHKAISITMRTPGHDAELAAGFLFTERIIESPDQIKQIRHCGLKIGRGKGTLAKSASLNSNTIRVDLDETTTIDLRKLERHFYTTSSCGVCGKSSIEALRSDIGRPPDLGFIVSDDLIRSLPVMLRTSQPVFEQTGGLHASALFTVDGRLDIVREDVGRHNALDKVIGRNFLDGNIPLPDRILLVSGRASFELVQKALMAGIPILAAVGAPSSLAVELANEYGMTLIGFLGEERFNIYSGSERIKQTARVLI